MWLRLFLDPALAGLSTVTVRQSPEPQNSYTGVHTGWNSWFAHWGQDAGGHLGGGALSDPGDIGRLHFPPDEETAVAGAVPQQLMFVLWLLSSLHANIPYLTGS